MEAALGVDQLAMGPQTAKKLKRLGIKSPKLNLNNGIRLDARTVVYPNKKIKTEAQLKKYIERKKAELNIK